MINKKNIKIFSLILSLIFLIIAIFKISQTYSVFYSELQGSSEAQIGRWDILVNNEQVTSGHTTTFTMDELDFSLSPFVLEGKIAPGMFGIGTISIKPNNVDVSFRYDITVDRSVITNQELTIPDLEVTNKTKDLIKTGENTYTGLVLLTEIVENYEDIIGLRVEWVNDDTNNEVDTELGTNPITGIPLPISIRFSQYLGEEINGI